jgi:hypothetical protein
MFGAAERILSSKPLIKPLKSRIANSTLPSFTRFHNPIDLSMLHLAMGWNCSAHVSLRNGLEWLSPCFILFSTIPLFSSGNVIFFQRGMPHPFGGLKCPKMLLGLKRD